MLTNSVAAVSAEILSLLLLNDFLLWLHFATHFYSSYCGFLSLSTITLRHS